MSDTTKKTPAAGAAVDPIDPTLCGPWEVHGGGASRRSAMYPGSDAGNIAPRENGFAWVIFSPHTWKAGSQGHAPTLDAAKAAVDAALPMHGWKAADPPMSPYADGKPVPAALEHLAAGAIVDQARVDKLAKIYEVQPFTLADGDEVRALGLPPLAHVDNPGVTAPRVGSLVDEIIAEAAAAEREACAKIAAEWVAMTQWDADEPGEQIATLIRARGAR